MGEACAFLALHGARGSPRDAALTLAPFLSPFPQTMTADDVVCTRIYTRE